MTMTMTMTTMMQRCDCNDDTVRRQQNCDDVTAKATPQWQQQNHDNKTTMTTL